MNPTRSNGISQPSDKPDRSTEPNQTDVGAKQPQVELTDAMDAATTADNPQSMGQLDDAAFSALASLVAISSTKEQIKPVAQVLIAWLRRFLGIEHEMADRSQLPSVQVLDVLEQRLSVDPWDDKACIEQLAQCDFLAWRVRGAQNKVIWDWRLATFAQFCVMNAPVVVYQVDQIFPTHQETVDYLRLQLAFAQDQ